MLGFFPILPLLLINEHNKVTTSQPYKSGNTTQAHFNVIKNIALKTKIGRQIHSQAN